MEEGANEPELSDKSEVTTVKYPCYGPVQGARSGQTLGFYVSGRREAWAEVTQRLQYSTLLEAGSSYYIKNETTGRWAISPSPLVMPPHATYQPIIFPRSEDAAVTEAEAGPSSGDGEPVPDKPFMFLFHPGDLQQRSAAEVRAYAESCAARGDDYELCVVVNEVIRSPNHPGGPSTSETAMGLVVWSNSETALDSDGIRPVVWEEPVT